MDERASQWPLETCYLGRSSMQGQHYLCWELHPQKLSNAAEDLVQQMFPSQNMGLVLLHHLNRNISHWSHTGTGRIMYFSSL